MYQFIRIRALHPYFSLIYVINEYNELTLDNFMNKIFLISLSIASIFNTSNIVANEFPICQSDIVKKMKRFENSQIAIPRNLITGKLREYALQNEILCPWEIEADINGDRQLDWIGVIQRNEKYELAAYISASSKYKLHILHTYQFFPEQSYLKIKKQNSIKNGRNKNSKKELFEVTLNDNSRVYRWNGKKMEIIRSFIDKTLIKTQDSNDLEIPRKRSNKL